MMKLLIISVTEHAPQNRVSDTIMHMALNTINGKALLWYHVLQSNSKVSSKAAMLCNNGGRQVGLNGFATNFAQPKAMYELVSILSMHLNADPMGTRNPGPRCSRGFISGVTPTHSPRNMP